MKRMRGWMDRETRIEKWKVRSKLGKKNRWRWERWEETEGKGILEERRGIKDGKGEVTKKEYD